MSIRWTVNLASPPDRTCIVAEVFFGDAEWAEVNQEQGELQVEFYLRPDGTPWRLPLEVAVAALEQAKRRLTE
jgi:hypothetical protein